MKYVSIILVVLFFNNIEAVTNKEFAACSKIKGTVKRIVCFDLLAEKYRLNKPNRINTNIIGKGKWYVHDSINPVDDSRTTYLSLDSNSKVSKWGKKASLNIRCKSRETEMWVDFKSYLGHKKTTVITRIGKSKAIKREWSNSTDNTAAFFPGYPVREIKKMMASDIYLAQTTPYSDSTRTAIFDTRGLKNAIKSLRDNCKW